MARKARLPPAGRRGVVRLVLVTGCICLGLLGSFPTLAQQFIFHLRNGDRLTGTIVTEDTHRVVLATSWTNRLELPVAQIERREAIPAPQAAASSLTNLPTPGSVSAPASLTDQQQKRLAELLSLYEADRITAAQYQERRREILFEPDRRWAPLALAPAPPAAPPARTLRQKLHLENWHGTLQVGMNLGYGTVRSEMYNTLFQANYAHGGFKNALEYTMAYGHTEGLISANRMEGTLKTELDLKQGLPFYVYHLGEAGYDKVRAIDLTYQEGAGLGYHLLQRTNLMLNFELGGSYQEYDYTNQVHNGFVSFRAGEELTWKLGSKLAITQRAQFIPNVADFSDYKMRAEAVISYPFLKNLTLNLNLIDNYDARPPLGVNHNDLQILSSLGYKY